jgi:dTDP-4-amino-4,6-dideoxygalactose transaminase
VVTTSDREHFTKHLAGANISCGQHYPVPCHLQKAYAYLDYKEEI